MAIFITNNRTAPLEQPLACLPQDIIVGAAEDSEFLGSGDHV